MDKYLTAIHNLNNQDVNIRLRSLKKLMEGVKAGILDKPIKKGYVNNHIHTIYSFSPYSPTKALWKAYNSGLTTAGIMDHDSISGAREFIEAGKITGISTTIGVECRVDMSNTKLKGKIINNPNQKSIAYAALHAIPHNHINDVSEFFKTYSVERNKRNRLMVDKINNLFKPFNIELNFNKDVVPISRSCEGGSITERHILFALGNKIISKIGKGKKLITFLEESFKLNINDKNAKYLMDVNNEFYEYDLLAVLKSKFVDYFYINAHSECPDVRELIAFAQKIGAISAYAYLGDVVTSVTCDKKAQKFEDDYLELLFDTVWSLGFNAVTYIPSRNTMTQLLNVKRMCEKYELFEISGEDVNSPRQSFTCDVLKKQEFKNLIDSTWALIGHEKVASKDIDNGMFSDKTINKYPKLKDRIDIYKRIGIKE